MAWRPVRDVDRVFDEMEETFQDVFGRPFYPVAWARTPEVRAWSPPMEIYENEQNYIVRMELPGVSRNDIEISVTEDTITIKGERKAPEGMEEESYLLCERCYGTFERTITFPTAIDTENISASYDEGILNLTVAKVAEAVGRKIEIKGGSQSQLGRGQMIERVSGAGQASSPSRQPESRGSRPRELQQQANLRESPASAELEREAFEYEQTGNPAQPGTDVHGELPGETGEVAEQNRSGHVRVVTPGEPVRRTIPRQRLEGQDLQSAAPDIIPGQTGELGDEGTENTPTPPGR
jgi:HSP20 family protein